MKAQGEITISRPITNKYGSRNIQINIREIGHVLPRMAIITIPLADFSRALTGLAQVDCKIDWHV